MRRGLLGVLSLLTLAGCAEPEPGDVDEVPPIGSLAGSFSCAITEPAAGEVDLGPAQFDGELDTASFIPGQRTQGCFARLLDAERGAVISVTLIQHLRFQRAQVLELNLPLDVLDDGGPLFEDDRLVFAGRGGFGSLYSLDVDEAPNLFARIAGGTVLLSAWEDAVGGTVAGSFDDLRVGDL